jgi:hypothetical protein
VASWVLSQTTWCLALWTWRYSGTISNWTNVKYLIHKKHKKQAVTIWLNLSFTTHEMCFTCPFWNLRCPVVNVKPRLRIADVEQWNGEQTVMMSTEEPETHITVENVADIFRIRSELSLYGEWMVGCWKERWKLDVGNVLFIYLLTFYTFILYTIIYFANTINAMWIVLKSIDKSKSFNISE